MNYTKLGNFEAICLLIILFINHLVLNLPQMILDNSGIDLGLITWTAAIKMFIFEALIANLIIPLSWGVLGSTLAFLAIIFILSVIIGTVESSMARFRMTHVFEFIFLMSITALIILALVTYRIYGG